MVSVGPRPLPPDDLLTTLCKAAAERDLPPRIVTFSRQAVEGLMGHVFGPGAAVNLTTGSSPLDLAAIDPRSHAVIARFLDPFSLDRVRRERPDWLAGASSILIHFPPERLSVWGGGALSRRRVLQTPAGREVILFDKPPAPLPEPPNASGISQPIRRLIILDPCLGGARGHYEPFARTIGSGAAAIGADVVWAGHRRLGEAPAGVQARPVFPRCFFDLAWEELAGVDLSEELLEGWVRLADEFDAPDAHVLVHSADAHLLRALSRLLEQRPLMQSPVHLVCYNTPSRMAGRAAGEEAHRVLLHLRRSAAFERRVFLWSENRRLGRWLEAWLQASVPTLPLLAPYGASGTPAVREGGRLVVSVLGESRPEKGFRDLPAIADAIAAAPDLARRLRLVVQNWRPFRADGVAHDEVIAALAAQSFVEVVEGELDPDSYRARLDEADVLLLPYDPQIYDLRSSGILVEGLSRGAAVVVRAGGALEEGGEGGLVRAYDAPAELATVLRDLLDDHQMAEARGRAEAFREANSPKRYVRALEARVAGG